MLLDHYTVIIPDLRGHGESSKPNIESDRETHEVYSKRSMAEDQVAVMYVLKISEITRVARRETHTCLPLANRKHFGYQEFYVVGHDRGGVRF